MFGSVYGLKDAVWRYLNEDLGTACGRRQYAQRWRSRAEVAVAAREIVDGDKRLGTARCQASEVADISL